MASKPLLSFADLLLPKIANEKGYNVKNDVRESQAILVFGISLSFLPPMSPMKKETKSKSMFERDRSFSSPSFCSLKFPSKWETKKMKKGAKHATTALGPAAQAV